MLVSYSYLSPSAVRIEGRYFPGNARSPVCVSEIFIPKKILKTAEVILLPVLLLGGTSFCEKSLQPRTTLPVLSIFSAVATMGRIGILNTPVKELDSVLEVVKQMGCRLSLEGKHLEVWQKERPKAVSLVQTQVYPGFPTDLQSVLMTTLSVSDGESQIEENIFSNRFKIAGELVRMGAEIKIEGRRARIKGKEKLYAMSLLAEDLRGGAALVLAGICAQGNSLIGNCHYIERGYEDICRDYRMLGATIEKIGRI